MSVLAALPDAISSSCWLLAVAVAYLTMVSLLLLVLLLQLMVRLMTVLLLVRRRRKRRRKRTWMAYLLRWKGTARAQQLLQRCEH
jgi:Flp pilus assembly protein TadB